MKFIYFFHVMLMLIMDGVIVIVSVLDTRLTIVNIFIMMNHNFVIQIVKMYGLVHCVISNLDRIVYMIIFFLSIRSKQFSHNLLFIRLMPCSNILMDGAILFKFILVHLQPMGRILSACGSRRCCLYRQYFLVSIPDISNNF